MAQIYANLHSKSLSNCYLVRESRSSGEEGKLSEQAAAGFALGILSYPKEKIKSYKMILCSKLNYLLNDMNSC